MSTVLQQGAGRPDAEECARLNALMDAAVDDLLDVLEPERARLLSRLTRTQAALRAWQVRK